MKWLFLSLVLLVAPMAIGSSPQTDITPVSVVASSTLDLVNPGPIEPGEYGYINIKGLTLQEVEKAMEEERFDLTVYPLDGVRVKSGYDFLFKRLELIIKAEKAGTYLVKMHIIRDGKFVIAATEVVVEGDDGPDPPGPDPPDPINGPRQVIFFAETSTVTSLPQDTQTLLASLKVRQKLKDSGHIFLGSYDVELTGKAGVPTELVTWFNKVKDEKLPVIATSPIKGGAITVVPFSKEELDKLIGGGK